MRLCVLGVDLASGAWRDNGTALVTFDRDGDWIDVDTGVVDWPARGRPSAQELTERIDAFCRSNGVAAVSIDGPQGWRDPDAPAGWGRRADREARTPGKMGPPRSCVPGTYLGWVSLSVELFTLLRTRCVLVNEPVSRLEPRPETYYLVESFPTSTWRTAGVAPLPAKAKTGDIATYADGLARAFGLPPLGRPGHDDLQAVAAALPAAALLGAAARAIPRGEPGRDLGGDWIEGIIWDAAPVHAPRRGDRRARDARPLLVVVTGAPATGKTTLARRLASRLDLPLVSRDDIKERLFDEIGIGDRAWSQRLGRASYSILFHWLETELRAGRSLVVESNFDVQSAELFRALPAHRTFQLHCYAHDGVAVQRFSERDRHPGHVDAVVVLELERGEHAARFAPLPLDGDVISIDTSAAVDVDAIAAGVRDLL